MNYFKTTLLLAVMTGILVLLGRLIGGAAGAVIFFILAGIMNFVAYWYSDKIVLRMYRAKEVGEADAPVLFRVVKRIADATGTPMPKVYVIDEPHANAFATGRNPRHASVAATTGLLGILDEDELEGVMAHELAHVRNRDILTASVAATIAGAITMIANVAQWNAVFGGYRSERENGGNLFGALLLAMLAPIAATLIQLAISRTREYAADHEGGVISRKPEALASALAKLEKASRNIPMQRGNPATAHLFIVHPFSAAASLFSTHPPTSERIQRLRELAATPSEIPAGPDNPIG
jgi:heat shock protein HtpX